MDTSRACGIGVEVLRRRREGVAYCGFLLRVLST